MSDELLFGECAGCFNGLERPFWDTYCFDCQEEMREEDREAAERIAEEDHFLYSVPLGAHPSASEGSS